MLRDKPDGDSQGNGQVYIWTSRRLFDTIENALATKNIPILAS